MSFIQQMFTECFPHARSCEESVIAGSRNENEGQKNVVTCSRKK